MSDAANALQAAAFAVLDADATLTAAIGAGRIFDHRRTGLAMPYLVIGEIVTRDFGPGCEEHALSLEVWSDAAGRKQCQALAGHVRSLLHDRALVLSGFALVNLIHQATEVRRVSKTRALVAEIRFRAVTE